MRYRRHDSIGACWRSPGCFSTMGASSEMAFLPKPPQG
jgi:hypothetical protein